MGADPAVLIVGGGITGCSLARDLSVRGIDCEVVDRGTLTANTSGRSHGLCHSGTRYAVADPVTARHCYRENRILRDIASGCIRAVGGLFLSVAGDDPDAMWRRVRACETIGIPAEHRDVDTVLARNPAITDSIESAVSVPDAVISPSRLVAATAASAESHGARIRMNTPVRSMTVRRGRVRSVTVGDERISPTHLVNAAGPWAGHVASLAGLDVPMAPTRGAMVASAQPDAPIAPVLNRCRPPDDGDILVPWSDRIVAGTTSVPVTDPDARAGRDWEVRRVLREAAELVPTLSDVVDPQVYWGVRPLPAADGNGAADRGFRIVDHRKRDDVAGVTTILGGKLTTARLMAERTGDHLTERLGVEGRSPTDSIELPAQSDPHELQQLVDRFGGPGPADTPVLG